MSRTILLADDSVTIQKVIELTFMDDDYQVVSVGNGAEALEELEKITPDVVIADVHMPGASGFDVTRRSKDLRPGVPVLLLVGAFEPLDEDEVASSGSDALLKKPFDSQELQRLVEDLLARSPAAAPAPPPAAAATPSAALDEADEGAVAALAPEETGEEEPAVEAARPFGDLGRAGEAEVIEMAAEEVSEESAADPYEPFALGLGAPEPADSEDAEDWESEPFGELDEEAPAARRESDWAAAPSGEIEPLREPWEADETGGMDETTALDETDELAAEAVGSTPGREAASLPGGEDEVGATQADAAIFDAEPAVARDGAFASSDDSSPPEEAGDEERDAAEAPEPASAAAGAAQGETGAAGPLSDDDVDRIARRVAEILGEGPIREVAWEVVPDMAEVVVRERLRELEGELESEDQALE